MCKQIHKCSATSKHKTSHVPQPPPTLRSQRSSPLFRKRHSLLPSIYISSSQPHQLSMASQSRLPPFAEFTHLPASEAEHAMDQSASSPSQHVDVNSPDTGRCDQSRQPRFDSFMQTPFVGNQPQF